MTKAQLISAIKSKIRANGTQEITGPALQAILLDLIDVIPESGGMNFKGTITVERLNALENPKQGDFYMVSNSGHVIKGNFDIAKNQFAVFNETDARWFPVESFIDTTGLQPRITGAATSVTDSDLPPGILVGTDSNGKIMATVISVENLANIINDLGDVKSKLNEIASTATNAQSTAAEAKSIASDAADNITEIKETVKATSETVGTIQKDLESIHTGIDDLIQEQSQRDEIQDNGIHANSEAISALDIEVKTNSTAINLLNEGENVAGSVKNTILNYIGKTQHARFKVVDALPPVAEAESNVLYLIPFPGKDGVYKQYIFADGKFVQLDNTEVDLSNYYNKQETDAEIATRVATTDFNAYKDAQANKDKAQDDRIKALEDKPAPSPISQCVPYTTDLDSVEDDMGLVWMLQDKTSDKDAHLFRKTDGGEEAVFIPANTYYIKIVENNLGIPAGNYYVDSSLGTIEAPLVYDTTGTYFAPTSLKYLKAGEKVWDKSGNYYAITDFDDLKNTLTAESIGTLSFNRTTNYTACRFVHADGLASFWFIPYVNSYGYTTWISIGLASVETRMPNDNSEEAKKIGIWGGPAFKSIFERYGYAKQSNEDVTIYLSSRVWQDVTPTDSAQIAAEVQRATAAEQELSNRIDDKADTSKWNDILHSQIEGAIADSHKQNTDTQLKDGMLFIDTVTKNIHVKSGVYVAGDVVGINGTHRLSQKLNANMVQTFSSIEDLIAGLPDAPEGAILIF